MFLGLVVSACMHLINATLSQTPTENAYQEIYRCENSSTYREEHSDRCQELLGQTRFGGLSPIAVALNEQDMTELKKSTDITGVAFLILLFSAFFGFQFIGQAPSLANKFASGRMGKPTAPGFATPVTSAAKSTALTVTKDLREAAGARIRNGVEKLASLPGAGIKKAYNWARGKNKNNSNSGSDGEDNGENEEMSSSSSKKNNKKPKQTQNKKHKRKPTNKHKGKPTGGSGKNRKKDKRKSKHKRK